MSKFTLNRRQMLRGMYRGSALALGLPLLEAMLDDHGEALASGGDLPLRFISFYWADGINIAEWEPPTTGAGYTMSSALQPLASFQPYLSVITGMTNQYSGQLITHHEGMCGFSGHPIQPIGGLSSNATGPTVDQVIADVPGVADATPVRAMHVRVSKPESTDGDGGTTFLAMSHRDTGSGLVAQVPELNPVNVYNNVFGRFVPGEDDGDVRLSVLDFVKDDANRLKDRVGMADQARIDAHLQGIYELEDKISAAVPICMLPDAPTETNTDTGGVEPISSVVDAMSHLIAQAFVCDVTRVASFLFKKFVSGTVFDEISATNIHHSASHNGPTDPNYIAGVTYMMQKFADLLQVMSSYDEPGTGNLLESTIIYATSDCSTGATHTIHRQPMMVAGSGRGYLVNPGVHYQSAPWNGNHSNPNSTGNMSDVLLTCLRAFDPSAASIGSGSLQSSQVLDAIIA